MLYITELVKRQIIETGIINFPEAGIGFLLGFEKRDIRIIEKIVISDIYLDADNFSPVTAQDQLDAALMGEEEGLSVLGIFYTLPNKPSVPDYIDYAALPDHYSILLLSVWGGDFINLQSWRMNAQEERVQESIAIVSNQYYEPLVPKTSTPFSINYN